MSEERNRNKTQPAGSDDAPSGSEPFAPQNSATGQSNKVKFEIFGEEMLEKRVKASGNSGRVYLPPDWVGHKVKIIRID